MQKQLLAPLLSSWFKLALCAAIASGCGDGDSDINGLDGGVNDGGNWSEVGDAKFAPDNKKAPEVLSTAPVANAVAVPLNSNITVTFSEPVAPATVNTQSMRVTGPDGTAIMGTVIARNTVATFAASSPLSPSTRYTVRIAKSVTDHAQHPLAADFVWSFTTGTTLAAGPMAVELGTSAAYIILSKAGISATAGTTLAGNIGVSPAAESSITGFNQARAATNDFSTSALVTGRIESSDMAVPTPSKLTTAIGDMEAAFTDAAGRTLPNFTESGAGNISGLTLAPGVYKWSTGVLLSTSVTLAGGANDVWIFQIAQGLTLSAGAEVTLAGGARAKNIFWQVAGQAVLGTTSKMKGNILSQTQIVMSTGSALEGRAFAQTAVTLDASTVTAPAP